MMRLVLQLTTLIVIHYQVAQSANFSPNQRTSVRFTGRPSRSPLMASTLAQSTDNSVVPTSTIQYNSLTSISTTQAGTTRASTTTTTQSDPNADPDELAVTNPTQEQPGGPKTVRPSTDGGPHKDPSGQDKTVNKSTPQPEVHTSVTGNNNLELNVLFFSIFIVFVSFIKLVYHNVAIIKLNVNEPGILMISGIIWELVARQITTNYNAFPRFNSHIFFYLFLPSTVLESASLLSNKWFFLNLLPIVVHSVLGTLLYAASLGFTIYSLSKQNMFYSTSVQHQKTLGALFTNNQAKHYNISMSLLENTINEPSQIRMRSNFSRESLDFGDWLDAPKPLYDKSYLNAGPLFELNNLTLADCLVFGTILSSVDSTTMLSMFRVHQVNDKLYYLVLGEGLMNNAVVLVILNLLLEFFNATRLTVVKIYIAILQFFLTLIGSIFVGLVLACVALISVRLTKRFQVPCALLSYQNQCQAMVETLLILKLAYLTYTLSGLAGTSSIVGLATFGILHDQYIKHNLNIRSQLTFRQVILATKTMGFSLVYPLLGMLLVEIANTSHDPHQSHRLSHESNNSSDDTHTRALLNANQDNSGSVLFEATSSSYTKLNRLANEANLYWNFKFLAFVILLTLIYRFVWVILLSLFCNLFSNSQLKIKFKEQILVAYGGLKGPLAFAIVNRIIEQGEQTHDNRVLRNKHPFIYTILFIIFISTIVKGCFIRPLVSKVQLALSNKGSPSGDGTLHRRQSVVFNEINSKVVEYVGHGLNNIIGHTKSPYDRFVELNETRIKPWLTRNGANTNWLSVFYDNLILDETLNANCFYRSIGDLKLQSYWNLNNCLRDLPSSQRKRAATLDTIEENGTLVRRRQVAPLPSMSPKRRSLSDRSTSSIFQPTTPQMPINSFITSRRIPSNIHADEPSNLKTNDESKNILKEFVMFNLKLEDAKRRKHSSVSQSSTRFKSSGTHQEEVGKHNYLPRPRMLSSTSSSDDMAREASSFELTTEQDRLRHLNEVERHLNVPGGIPEVKAQKPPVRSQFFRLVPGSEAPLSTQHPNAIKKSKNTKVRSMAVKNRKPGVGSKQRRLSKRLQAHGVSPRPNLQ